MATSLAPTSFPQRSMSLPNAPKPLRPRGPKLSLDTAAPQLSIHAISSAIVAGATPTTHNTFSNSFMCSTPDLIQPSSSDKVAPTVRHDSGIALPLSASTIIPQNIASDTNSAPQSAASEPCPYVQSPGIRSILVNGPLSKRSFSSRTSSLVSEFSDTPTSQYQSNKRVCFKQPLQEDIQTKQYVLAHSDLPSRSPSPSDSSKRRLKRREREGIILRQSIRENSGTPDLEIYQTTSETKAETAVEATHSADNDESHFPSTPKLGRRWRDREKMWSRATAFVAQDDIPRQCSPSPSPVSPTTNPSTEGVRNPPRLYSPPPPASNDDLTPSPDEHETRPGSFKSTPDRQQLSTALETFRTGSPSPSVDGFGGGMSDTVVGYPHTLQLPAALEAFKGGMSSASEEEDLDTSMKETIAAATAFS